MTLSKLCALAYHFFKHTSMLLMLHAKVLCKPVGLADKQILCAYIRNFRITPSCK